MVSRHQSQDPCLSGRLFRAQSRAIPRGRQRGVDGFGEQCTTADACDDRIFGEMALNEKVAAVVEAIMVSEGGG